MHNRDCTSNIMGHLGFRHQLTWNLDIHCRHITHRPSSFRSNLIAYFMSALLLPQWLHCTMRTNTYYGMILDSGARRMNVDSVFFSK